MAHSRANPPFASDFATASRFMDACRSCHWTKRYGLPNAASNAPALEGSVGKARQQPIMRIIVGDDSACVRPVERRAASHAASGASVSACHQLAGGSYGEASLGCRSCGALMVADTRRLGAKMRTAASQPVGALYTCRAERFDFWPDNAMNQLLAAYGTELALARSHIPITLMRHDV